MAKFKLVANPTFQADVPIPVAGGDPVPIKFTFRHRTQDDLKNWMESRAGRSDIDGLMDMVVGWPGLEDEFTRENAETLLENYGGAGLAIFKVYIEQLLQSRLGN